MQPDRLEKGNAFVSDIFFILILGLSQEETDLDVGEALISHCQNGPHVAGARDGVGHRGHSTGHRSGVNPVGQLGLSADWRRNRAIGSPLSPFPFLPLKAATSRLHSS